MNEDERVKDIARGIALEKDAERAETGVFLVVAIPLTVVLLILGSKFSPWGGWTGVWAVLIAVVVATWAMKDVKARALR